jgi:hypothetical protein
MSADDLYLFGVFVCLIMLGGVFYGLALLSFIFHYHQKGYPLLDAFRLAKKELR